MSLAPGIHREKEGNLTTQALWQNALFEVLT